MGASLSAAFPRRFGRRDRGEKVGIGGKRQSDKGRERGKVFDGSLLCAHVPQHDDDS